MSYASRKRKEKKDYTREDIAHSKTMKDIVNYIRSEANKELETSEFSNYRITKIS